MHFIRFLYNAGNTKLFVSTFTDKSNDQISLIYSVQFGLIEKIIKYSVINIKNINQYHFF